MILKFAQMASHKDRRAYPHHAQRSPLQNSGRLSMWTPWSSWMKDYGFYQAIQIACLVLLFGNASAIAQQTLSLDMATVAGLARDRSWSSKQAHQEAAAAVAVAQQASSMRWGRVDFQSQYLRLNDPIEIKSPIPASLASVLGIAYL